MYLLLLEPADLQVLPSYQNHQADRERAQSPIAERKGSRVADVAN